MSKLRGSKREKAQRKGQCKTQEFSPQENGNIKKQNKKKAIPTNHGVFIWDSWVQMHEN